ncbi:cell division protein FtsQ [Alphaproteobacteria bacterium]|nr:cell division protein FtsQ [Alphaproteobacteria bacterium]GHS95609.1 cell division protein FtsQ [Alphaproteobacteria bacterium]
MRRAIKNKKKSETRGGPSFLAFLFSKAGLGVASGIVLLFAGLLTGTQHDPSRFRTVAQSAWGQVLENTGFMLKEVLLFGRYRSSQEEILQTLDIKEGQYLFTKNLDVLRQKLLTLEWLKDVRIHRSLCGALYIYVTEREPIALFHDEKQKKFFLVDKEGHLINKPIAPCFRGLPLLSGKNAEKKAFKILEKLNRFAAIRAKVSALAFIQNRRWNLQLDHHIEVKLPEADVEKALKILEKLILMGKVSTGDVKAIDLRQRGRVTLQLSESGKSFLKSSGYRPGVGRERRDKSFPLI